MYSEQERYKRAKKRVRKKRAFYSNFFSWIITCTFLFFINLRTSPYHIWAIYPFLGWGIGVAFDAWGLYGPNGLLTDEEEEIEKEMAWMRAKGSQDMEDYYPAERAQEESPLELPDIPKMWNDKDYV